MSSVARVLAVLLLAAPCGCTLLGLGERPIPGGEVQSLKFWGAALDKPLAERIAPAPPALIEFLRADNERNGFPERPELIAVDAGMKADLASVLAGLPPLASQLLAPTLIAVIPVKGLGGSAFTDLVYDHDKKVRGAFVVIDVDAMQRKANEWFSWKEGTPFTPSSRMRLVGTIEESADDTRRNALEYILLHEFGHVVGILYDVHPNWNAAAASDDLTRFPFVTPTWTSDGQAVLRRVDAKTAVPGQIVYYKPAPDKPAAERMPEFYTWLAGTDFPTLYASVNMYDDFAESFATYVHAVMLAKPWRVVLEQDGKEVMSVTTCWTQPRCAAKRAALEKVLARGATQVAR